MKNSENIVHDGIVEKIINDVAFISFRQSSGCSGCSIQSSCGMSESKDKTLEIPVDRTQVAAGDPVLIQISMKSGYKAVFISYFIPFLVVLATLSLLVGLGVEEALAGVVALLVLIPCYGLIRILSRFYKNDLSFEVQKR